MSKIRVAFFAEILLEDFDGASRTIFQIIRKIPEHQFEFLFICGVPPEDGFAYEVFEVPAITIPFNKNYKMAVPYFHKCKLNEKLEDFKPDIIHISTPSPLGTFGLEYAKTQGIPVITIYHTHFISYIDYYLEHISILVDPVKNMIVHKLKKFYEDCDMVYMPTRIMVSELKHLGISDHNMKIWPRGLDTSNFDPEKRNVSFIKNLTGNDRPNILFASRLVWEKNLKTLIKIYKKSIKRGLLFNFIIAGDGVALEEMKEAMPSAYFLGKLTHEQLATVYASCDVFLFTSVTETCGNVVAEAMASGLPCVIANGGGSAGFIEDGVNGFLCQPESSNDYLGKISKVLFENELREQYIEKGLHFTSKLKWESLTDIYFNDLTTLTGKEKPVLAEVE